MSGSYLGVSTLCSCRLGTRRWSHAVHAGPQPRPRPHRPSRPGQAGSGLRGAIRRDGMSPRVPRSASPARMRRSARRRPRPPQAGRRSPTPPRRSGTARTARTTSASIRRATSRTTSTTPAANSPETSPVNARIAAGSSARRRRAASRRPSRTPRPRTGSTRGRGRAGRASRRDRRQQLRRRRAGSRRSARRRSAIGMTGRVSTSGRSRWSRSVANPTTSVANHAPNSDQGERIAPPNRVGSSANANAPNGRADDGPPADRPAGGILVVVLGPARREPVGEDPEHRPDGGEAEREQASSAARSAGRRRAYASRAPASASSTSVAWVTPVAPRARERRRLAEVARAADVEVGPRHGPELAQEEAALDERALGRAGVLEVAVPALHLGHVVVDERDLPVALGGPVGGGRRRRRTSAWGVPKAPVIRCPNARETAPVSVATSTMWVAPSRSA